MTAPDNSPEIDIPWIKSQLGQLKILYGAGTLSQAAYDESRRLLERRVLDWALQETPAAVTLADSVEELPVSPEPVVVTAVDNPMSMQKMTILAAVAVAVVAIIGYQWFGRTPSALPKLAINTVTAPVIVASAPGQAPHTNNLSDLSVMTDKLAARLKTAPNDAAGWALLARSYVELGQHPEAIKAYQKAIALQGNDPVLLADYAEALAAVNQKNLKGASIQSSVATQRTSPNPGK
jgi:cytochrome c-type biogenesis protein CcmH